MPLGLDIVIFALLFRYVPSRYVAWDAVWAASLFGAIGWELARAGFAWYLANLANYQFVYGGIATVIVLLIWAYLTASIFIFSAELCARLNEWLHMQAEERYLRRQAQMQQLLDEDMPHLAVGAPPSGEEWYANGRDTEEVKELQK